MGSVLTPICDEYGFREEFKIKKYDFPGLFSRKLFVIGLFVKNTPFRKDYVVVSVWNDTVLLGRS